jgi:adenylylsulfate kinase-like enzyme
MNRNLEAPPANVTWHDGHLSRAARKSAIGYGGATVWLTGLPASGKSTIAMALERDLVLAGRPASLVSPYAADRLHAREVHERDGLPFLEVFVDTPPAECERRDPKGLYAKARAGEIPDFTGVSMPYEPPGDAELTITPDEPLEHSVWRLLEALHRATT